MAACARPPPERSPSSARASLLRHSSVRSLARSLGPRAAASTAPSFSQFSTYSLRNSYILVGSPPSGVLAWPEITSEWPGGRTWRTPPSENHRFRARSPRTPRFVRGRNAAARAATEIWTKGRLESGSRARGWTYPRRRPRSPRRSSRRKSPSPQTADRCGSRRHVGMGDAGGILVEESVRR